MTEEIRQYIAELEKLLNNEEGSDDWERLSKELLIRISFYQHERLIHLIVTVAFAVMTAIFYYLSLERAEFLVITGLFLLMDIPYVLHYRFLENAVQKLYKYYYSLPTQKKHQ